MMPISSKILEMHRNIYTTPWAANAILHTLPLSMNSTLIDLGCGNGVFLEAAGAILAADNRSQDGADRLCTLLAGVDSDPAAVAATKAALSRRFGPAATEWNVVVRDALQLPYRGEYDFVVGNPPWVRIHHLEASSRALLRSEFESASGNFDLAYLFVEQGLRLLRPGGHLRMVVPWGMRVQPAAERIRRLLTENGAWEVERLPQDWFVPSAEIDPALLSFEKKVIQGGRTEACVATLGDIAYVSSGVPTGADSVFLQDDSRLAELRLEPGWIRPVLRGRDTEVLAELILQFAH